MQIFIKSSLFDDIIATAMIIHDINGIHSIYTIEKETYKRLFDNECIFAICTIVQGLNHAESQILFERKIDVSLHY